MLTRYHAPTTARSEKMASVDSAVREVFDLCLPHLGLSCLVRVSLCSKQLAQLCAEHLAVGDQQHARQLLLGEVQESARLMSRYMRGSKSLACLTADPLELALYQQQLMQHSQSIGWLLRTVDITALFTNDSEITRRLVSDLIGLQHVPPTVARMLLDSGMHVSCCQVIEAARLGPLAEGFQVWLLQHRDACQWIVNERLAPLACCLYRMFGGKSAPWWPQDSCFEDLSTAELVSVAYVAIHAPYSHHQRAGAVLESFRKFPAARAISVKECTQLLTAVVDRLLQVETLPYYPAGHLRVCLAALCGLPVVHQVEVTTVVGLLHKAIAQGDEDLVMVLCNNVSDNQISFMRFTYGVDPGLPTVLLEQLTNAQIEGLMQEVVEWRERELASAPVNHKLYALRDITPISTANRGKRMLLYLRELPSGHCVPQERFLVFLSCIGAS